MHEFAQALARLGPGIDDAAAGVEDRALGIGDKVDGGSDRALVAVKLRPVALVLRVGEAGVNALGELDVLGDVDDDRPGATGARDIERLVQDAGELVHVLHEVIVLGAGPGDADGVAFLERVIADEVGRHLTGDADDGNGIHQRVGEAGDGIGGAGTRGDEHAADLAGRARVTFRGVNRALLVAHQDVLQTILLEQLVVDRKHGAAGVAENVVDPLVGQNLQHHLGASHCA